MPSLISLEFLASKIPPKITRTVGYNFSLYDHIRKFPLAVFSNNPKWIPDFFSQSCTTGITVQKFSELVGMSEKEYNEKYYYKNYKEILQILKPLRFELNCILFDDEDIQSDELNWISKPKLIFPRSPVYDTPDFAIYKENKLEAIILINISIDREGLDLYRWWFYKVNFTCKVIIIYPTFNRIISDASLDNNFYTTSEITWDTINKYIKNGLYLDKEIDYEYEIGKVERFFKINPLCTKYNTIPSDIITVILPFLEIKEKHLCKKINKSWNKDVTQYPAIYMLSIIKLDLSSTKFIHNLPINHIRNLKKLQLDLTLSSCRHSANFDYLSNIISGSNLTHLTITCTPTKILKRIIEMFYPFEGKCSTIKYIGFISKYSTKNINTYISILENILRYNNNLKQVVLYMLPFHSSFGSQYDFYNEPTIPIKINKIFVKKST